MATRQTWLVFDLGGVLVDVEPGETWLARLSETSATPMAELHALVRERFTQRPFSLAEQLQCGELDEAAFIESLNARLRRPLDPETLRRHVVAMLKGEHADSVALLPSLARRWRLACYSNTNAIHWRHMRAHYGFFRHLEVPMASHAAGLAKPDPRVFEYAQDRLAAAAEDCLLVDDREINVDAARRAGWSAIHYRDAADLEALLEAPSVSE